MDWLEPRPEFRRQWQDFAACRNEPSTWFFPANKEQQRARQRREAHAKAICQACPVMQLCREHALRVDEPWGIWGALNEEERALVRVLAQRRTEPEPGLA